MQVGNVRTKAFVFRTRLSIAALFINCFKPPLGLPLFNAIFHRAYVLPRLFSFSLGTAEQRIRCPRLRRYRGVFTTGRRTHSLFFPFSWFAFWRHTCPPREWPPSTGSSTHSNAPFSGVGGIIFSCATKEKKEPQKGT